MRKINLTLSLMVVSVMVWIVGCQPKSVEMTLETRAAVADTISILMNQLIASAEAANAEETGALLMMDTTSIYFISGIPYGHCEMVATLDSLYEEMGWQKINFEFSQVYVLSPDAALWVGYGTNVVPTADGEETLQVTDSWLWQKKHGQWGVYHFHESIAPVPTGEEE